MHRYYNPELSESQMMALDRDNMAVLAATQAAVGNISADIRALFVDAKAQPVVLHFVVAEGRVEACEEDVDDTLSALIGANWGEDDLRNAVTRIHVEEVPRDWHSLGWRPVYWAKGWSAWRE